MEKNQWSFFVSRVELRLPRWATQTHHPRGILLESEMSRTLVLLPWALNAGLIPFGPPDSYHTHH